MKLFLVAVPPSDEAEHQAYSMAQYGLVNPDFVRPQTALGMNDRDSMPTNPYSTVPPPYALPPQTSGGSGIEELEGRSSALSPQQYAMLMNSMRDPLAMYSASLPGQDRAPSNQFDPLEMYSGQPYNISPTYSGSMQEEVGPVGEENHPVFTMMSSTYQPKPPTGPRPPTAPKKPGTQSRSH